MKKRKPNKLRILKHPHPGLDIVSEPINFEEWGLVNDLLVVDMIHTMEKAEGVGLAASQVNEFKRVFVMRDHVGDIHVWVNPEIDNNNAWANNEKTLSTEGCLSCPGILANMERLKRVVARGYTINWYKEDTMLYKTKYLDNLHDSIVFQHELDHLNGKTLLNNGDNTIIPSIKLEKL